MSTPAERRAKIQAAAPKQQGPNKIVLATIVAVLAIVGVVVGTVIAKNSSGTDTVAVGSLPKGVTESGGGMSTERAKAGSTGPVVDVYEDFQCPVCGQFEQLFGAKITELDEAGTIRLRYHVLTFLDGNLRNDSSARATNAAMCAADQGKFGAFHDVVYAHQPEQEGKGWTDAEIAGFAGQAGLSGSALTAWQTCTTAQTHDAYIASVQSAADKDGVTGTPTIRVDGKDFSLQGVTAADFADKLLAAAK